MDDPRLAHKSLYLAFLKKLSHAPGEAELNFSVVNEAIAVWDYERAYLIERRAGHRAGHGAGHSRLLKVSGQVDLNTNTPAHAWLMRWVGARSWNLADVVQEPVSQGDATNPGADEFRDALLSEHLLTVPLGRYPGQTERYLLLSCAQPWSETEIEHAALAGRVYEKSLKALRGERLRWLGWFQQTRARWAAALLVLLALVLALVRVPATASAPAEIVPLTPFVVSAPQDGVVREILVEPNAQVQAGQLLVVLDDDVALNRRKIALESLNIAKTDALTASQRSFVDERGKADLNIALGRIAEKEAELKAIDAQISKVVIRADRAGVAVFSDANDWRGRPVQTGERIMRIAQSEDAGVLVWLSVADALDLKRGDHLSLFLHLDPTTERRAEIIEIGYLPELGPDNVSAYRIKARLVGEAGGGGGGADQTPRLGLRGVARLFGREVSLGYYLFRRPVALVWQYLGWLW